MLQTKRITISNKYYIYNYSDAGFYIERDGELYEDAVDPYNTREERIYTETDVPITHEDPEEETEATEETE